MKTPLLSGWRASPTVIEIMNKKKREKDKAKTKQRRERERGGGECGFCTGLACPPHPTQFLSLSSLKSKSHYSHIGFFCLLLLCFLCNCLCLLLLLPLLSTCKWGRNHTLNFLLLFDTHLFSSHLLAIWLGILPNMTFLLFSIHMLPLLSCFSFVGTP